MAWQNVLFRHSLLLRTLSALTVPITTSNATAIATTGLGGGMAGRVKVGGKDKVDESGLRASRQVIFNCVFALENAAWWGKHLHLPAREVPYLT